MTNKTSQKDYYDSFGDFDAIELGVVDGSENEYRKRFIARRAEKMAKIAGLDDESTVLELGCGTGICSTHWVKSSIKFYGLGLFSEVGIRVERKIFMGFVPHQIIPVSVARYFMFMEVLEKVLERIPWVRAWGG